MRKNSKLKLVKPSLKLRKENMRLNTEEEIMNRVKELKESENLNDDISLIHFIINLVENSDIKDLDNEKVKHITKNVIVKLYPSLNNNQSLNRIQKDIDFILEEANLLQKYNCFNVVSRRIKHWIQKKIC